MKLIKSFIYSQLSSLKAYHKANEERKDLHQEITDVRNSINAIKEKQDLLNIQTQAITAANNPSLNVNTNNGTTSRTNFSRLSNSDYYYRLELTQILFFFSFFFLYIFVWKKNKLLYKYVQAIDDPNLLINAKKMLILFVALIKRTIILFECLFNHKL